MSFDYFSKNRVQYILTKLKDIFDTKANILDVPDAFADLTDVEITSPVSGQIPVYNSTTSKWENGNVSSANDGVLTIQKNGVDVQTFSANQSTNVTANITVPTTASDVGAIPTTQKGVASGVAELDTTGKVPSSQLPSYVDDTIEGYLYNGHWYSDAEHTQEVVGETGKIYVELSTNKSYRWSGTTFVEISESLALGETSSTAYRGDRGATAYSHATDTNKVSSATATGLYKVGATAEGHISELQVVQKSDITALGIPGAVKLTITVSESEDPQTGDEVLVADKTPSEVLTALNGGMVVEAVYEGRVCSIAQNLLSSAGRILFGVTVGGDNVGLFFNGLMFIKDSQDDAWESITLLNSNTTQRLNASIDYSNNTYSCDYTYDEFEDARSNGQEILVEYDDVIYYFTKYDSSEYTYYFSSTLADSDGTATNTFVMVGDDTTGDWDSITLTESSGGSASSFLVRVYEDPQTQQTTCDKLPSEILAAYTNGSIIQAKIELEGEDAMLDLATCLLSSSPYLVVFSTLVTRQDNDTVTLSLHLQKDSSSDTWEDIDIYQSDLCHYVGNISHDTNGYYFDITPSKFDDAISYSLGARIKYVDSDNDVTYDFYLSRYDASDSEHTVFYLTSVNADSTGETTILTFALYPDWELDDWDNIVLYETNGSGDIIWTGTQAEYNAQASSIPVGAYVNITDDQEVIGGSLETLSDTNISSPTNGQTLVYNSISQKWENGSGGGGVSLPIDISDNVNNVTGILNIANGGTGNSSGYVRAGQSSGSTIGTRATAEGYNVVSSGECAHAEGLSEDSTYKIQATGKGAHAEGYIGSGYVSNTLASGNGAHAEGSSTQATATCAHSEGLGSIASAMCAHAEGSGIATGQASHAEGTGSEAKGTNSHAEGQKTIARGGNSHAQGRYNIEDLNDTYAHIVGNGTSSARSNAHTLDWSGNAWFAGDVEDGNSNTISKNSEDLRYYESAGYLGRNLWRGATTLSGSGSIGYSRAESKTNKIIISGKISSTTSGTLTFDLNSYNDSTQTGSYTTYSFWWSGQKTDYAFTPILQTLGDGYHLTSCSVSSSVDITLTDFQIEDGETAHTFTKYVPTIPTIVNDRYLHTNATTGNLEWVQGGGGGSSATVLGGTLEAGDTQITFTDNAITATAMIDIYTDDSSVGWIDRTVSGTTLTLIFPPQENDLIVRVRLEETGE